MTNPTKKGPGQLYFSTGRTGAIMLLLFLISCSTSSAPEIWEKGTPKHHIQGGFRNYPSVAEPQSATFGFYLRRFWGSFVFPDIPSGHTLPESDAIQQYEHLNGHDTITWLGHATFLIRLNGMTILTDPFLTKYASPVKY